MRMDRMLAAAFVVLVSTAIVGFSTGNTGASFTGTTTNPGQILNTVGVQPPAAQNAAVSASGGAVNLSWTATPTAPNGHTITYLVMRNGTQIGTTASLVYSDTPVADGTYSYTIQTKIAQGAGFFTSGNSAAQNGTSDRVAPTKSITCNGGACASATWYTVSPTIAITGTDNAGGVGMGTVTRNIDAGGNVSGASPMTFTPADGNHSIVYFATDAAGNAAANATQTVKVDTTAPTAASGITTAKGVPSGTIVATWTAATDASSGVSAYTIHRSGVVASCPAANPTNYPTATAVGNVTSTTISGLGSGSKYCFYLTTADVAGNVSANSAPAGPQPAR